MDIKHQHYSGQTKTKKGALFMNKPQKASSWFVFIVVAFLLPWFVVGGLSLFAPSLGLGQEPPGAIIKLKSSNG